MDTRNRPLFRALPLLAGLLAVSLGFAPAALAGTRAEVVGGQLRITGESDPNEIIVSVIERAGVDTYRVTDNASDFPFPDGASMTAGSGCVEDPSDGDTAFCNFSPVEVLVIRTGADLDKVTINPSVPDEAVIDGGSSPDELRGSLHPDRIDGGDGNDVIEGGTPLATTPDPDIAADTLLGGAGNDAIDGQGGDDSLAGGEGDDLLIGGDDEDTMTSDVGADRYLGGDGGDIVDYLGHPIAGVSVTLDGIDNDGNAVDSRADNVGTSVEAVLGTSGADFLSGSSSNNTLSGRGSNDTLRGNGGQDRLIGSTGGDILEGGTDVDTAVYTEHADPVNVSLDDVRNDGNSVDGSNVADRDNVRFDVEAVDGGPSADILTGSSGLNILKGNGGDDRLEGLAGPDTLSGGAGIDTVTYRDRTGSVLASLDGVPDDGNGLDGPIDARDNVSEDVETLIGGSGNDALTGNAGANTLVGAGGADVLFGEDGDDALVGDTGVSLDGLDSDVIDGGNGTDLVSYANSLNSVVVDLDGEADDGADTDRDGVADEADQVRDNVEDIEGGPLGDVLTGSAGPNSLFGLGGEDRLNARRGDDRLDGGDNVDLFKASGGADVISAIDDNAETVRCGGGIDSGSADLIDLLDDCENVGTPQG